MRQFSFRELVEAIYTSYNVTKGTNYVASFVEESTGSMVITWADLEEYLQLKYSNTSNTVILSLQGTDLPCIPVEFNLEDELPRFTSVLANIFKDMHMDILGVYSAFMSSREAQGKLSIIQASLWDVNEKNIPFVTSILLDFLFNMGGTLDTDDYNSFTLTLKKKNLRRNMTYLANMLTQYIKNLKVILE